jgi:hypothetical protein
MIVSGYVRDVIEQVTPSVLAARAAGPARQLRVAMLQARSAV